MRALEPLVEVVGGTLGEQVDQQALIVESQTKIDEKIAVIAEDVRVARIFVARGGGKAK